MAVVLAGAVLGRAHAQEFRPIQDTGVPDEVERAYVRGIDFLAKSQNGQGTWDDGQNQVAICSLAVLAMLAHGEDPNTGPYAANIRKGLSYILTQVNKTNGYIGNSMYNHGFSTLALAEAYGMVDDDRLGPALKQAVDLSLASQKVNPQGAWRYNPEASDADTTVSGAVLVSLFAARNAGLEVPDEAVEKALKFYLSTQDQDGGIGYTAPGGSSPPRNAIGTLVLALAKRKATSPFKRAFDRLHQDRDGEGGGGQQYYFNYYAAQAYFQGDFNAWREWNTSNYKQLLGVQDRSGGWQGNNGNTFATATALLSIAVNFRFLPIYER